MMAKKKNAEMLKFLEEKIAQAERAIVHHNGAAIGDFDKIFRYLKLRDYYENEVPLT